MPGTGFHDNQYGLGPLLQSRIEERLSYVNGIGISQYQGAFPWFYVHAVCNCNLGATYQRHQSTGHDII